ncbi:unnamed protein product [Symbiodinium microadriaticum]|nr:unnamed protein product [Symbiodinium microadriaticum]
MLPVMPFKMTRFSPGEAPEPIESSAGALAGTVSCEVKLCFNCHPTASGATGTGPA